MRTNRAATPPRHGVPCVPQFHFRQLPQPENGAHPVVPVQLINHGQHRPLLAC